jgi:hypothetical protein
MLEIAGRERIEYRARWVSEAAFTVNREMRLVIRITGTDNVRPVTFYVAQLHVVLHELELGWPELQKRRWLPRLEGVMNIHSVGNGNTRDKCAGRRKAWYLRTTMEVVETDTLMWADDYR